MYTHNNFSRQIIIMLFLSAFLGSQSYAKEDFRDSKIIPPQQHALVVGIDQYQYAGQLWDTEGIILKNLEGAVNDANLLTEALRHAKIQLPPSRILINANATRANFVKAWQNMVKQSQSRRYFNRNLFRTWYSVSIRYLSKG